MNTLGNELHNKRFITGWLPVLLAILWLPVLVCVSLELLLRVDPIAHLLFVKLGVDKVVPDFATLHAQVMDLVTSGVGFAPGRFTPEEIHHLHDVHVLVTRLRWASLPCLALVFSLGWLGKCLRQSMNTAARLVAGLLCGVGLAALEWVLFFYVLHPVLFPGGGWEFSPHRHVLVRLYPEIWFGVQGALLLGICCALALGLRVAAGELSSIFRMNMQGLKSTLPKILLGSLVLAAGCYFAGQHTLERWAPGQIVYLVLVAGLVCFSVGAWLAEKKAFFICVLAGLLLCYGGLDLGLRKSVEQARVTVEQGNVILKGVYSYARAHRKLPRDLQVLVPGYLQSIPEPALPNTKWEYKVGPNRFVLQFVGPLRYYHVYSSWRQRWKTIPL